MAAVDQDILAAARGLRPDRDLYQMAKDRAAAGATQDEQEETFGEAMLELRRLGEEEAEDHVLNVLDTITGWCSPRIRIYNAQS